MTVKTAATCPIGVFDSGIGGISVVKQIMQQLPNESIVYFGDIARLPYGTKSVATIRRFARQTAAFLLKQNIKALVIACNTISAVAKDAIEELAQHIPVFDVLSAGSLASTTLNPHTKKIGVIATNATVNSRAYTNAISQLNPHIQVFEIACPLFVPLIEEGYLTHQALKLVATEYLAPFNTENIDTLILGCTHYPLIISAIKQILKQDVLIIDPALGTTMALTNTLSNLNVLNQDITTKPQHRFYVTELSANFSKIAEMFLATSVSTPMVVDLATL